MGTSQSSPGPGGGSPLVPPWADDQPQQALPSPMPARFKAFRQSLGSFVSSGNRGDLQSAVGHYAQKASGGGSSAARRMGSVTRAGGNLFGVLSGGSAGAATGEAALDLNDLAGLTCDQAIPFLGETLCHNISVGGLMVIKEKYNIISNVQGN